MKNISDYQPFRQCSYPELANILERRGETIAIEVKSGHRTSNKGITIFREHYHPRHAIIVGSGGIAIEDFLQFDLRKL